MPLRPSSPAPSVAPLSARPRWLGPDDRPLLGWLSTPPAGGSESGVLILPPVGYHWWSVHRTLRVLAERLADAGHLALRLDYDGTGDSAGDQWDAGRLAAWRQSVRHGAEELRALGVRELHLAGVRLGGTLALLEGAELGAESVVAWTPVTRGRRYVRQIKLLSTPVPDGARGGGAEVEAGSVFTAQTLTDIARIDLHQPDWRPPARVTFVNGEETLTERLRQRGSEVELFAPPGGADALEAPAEYATVPEEVVETLCAAIGPGTPGRTPAPPPVASARMTWRGVELEEEVVFLGPSPLTGVLTHPATPRDGAPTVLFLNSGSEPHVGPGRAWVEYARGLAVSGFPVVRADFRGWGESPDDGHGPGRPYDPHGVEDARALVRALCERGHERLVLAGLCAGAWIALRTVLEERLAGVVALNPQLYWQPGDPVEATMAETRQRREPERRRDAEGARLDTWDAHDRAGQRPWAARWLDQLRATEVPVLLLFAEGDDGIEYLRTRHGRRTRMVTAASRIAIAEVPGIDHSMHRAWLRNEMLDRLRGFASSV